MCGIAGKIYLNNNTIADSDLSSMAKVIAHRGPDDEGLYISPNKKVGLVNRRLAVIDLSLNGHQPMLFKNRYIITYNGEIYNFQEERQKLAKLGYKFTSKTDTEVILALYDKYKTNCVQHLRGMFAFAIFDKQANTLFLARDRVGKKPLKFYYKDGVFIFASELKAILTQKEVHKGIDYAALQAFLIYGYCPAPMTGFVNIQKLQPGHFLVLDLTRKSYTIHKYWEPMYDKKLRLSESQWCQKILDTLDESTRIRMVSDVPIGAFLSGGVDSSAVVNSMSKFSSKPIDTFTIIVDDKKFSEAKYANTIAKIFKTNHHELLVKAVDVQILDELTYFYEEPYSEASSVLSYFVSRLARKHITVVLNGDGADENFAGYPNRYFRLQRDVDFDFWIKKLRPLAASSIKGLSKITQSPMLTKIDKFFLKSKLPLYERFASYNQIFQYSEIDSFAINQLKEANLINNPYFNIEKCFQQFKGKDLKDAGLKFDMLYWLPDDLLTKMDIATMSNSLEARSPFLDQKMIEMACRIPFTLKTKNGVSKYILKKALEKIIPKENLYRPKMGFGIPLHKWFKTSLKDYSTNILLSKNARISTLVRKEVIENMLACHSAKNDYGPRLWALLSLELWLKKFFD